jgi:hypothetical protein
MSFPDNGERSKHAFFGVTGPGNETARCAFQSAVFNSVAASDARAV